jgi:Mrp family chromosome partitioning ATPase
MERDEEGLMLEHDIAEPSAQSAAQRWRERLGRADEQPAPGAAERWRAQLRRAEAPPAPTTTQRWRERFSPAAAQPAAIQAPGWLARLKRLSENLPFRYALRASQDAVFPILSKPQAISKRSPEPVEGAAGSAVAQMSNRRALISPTPALEREAAPGLPAPDVVERGRPMFPDAQIPPALDPASPLMEACRVLRANLAAGRAGGLKSLVVIAPSPDASCALIASGLALALAEEGNSTLLVDADLRTPVLHKLFAIEPGPGFADLLLANDLSELRPVRVTGHLSALPAGTAGRSPAVLFRLPAIGRVTGALAQQFDVVIYHISGQWTMPDALVFAPSIGAAIFTIRAGRDSADQIRRMKEPLERAGVEILGFAMIGEAQE